ncbi:MAG: hypothetical protein PVG14_07525 [Anaerolineales bacterium]|jgi:hypothetical protein
MKTENWILMVMFIPILVAACSLTAPPTPTPAHIDPMDSAETPGLATDDSVLNCPPATGEGTISPAVSIYSITFMVNGVEYVVRDDDALRAQPGDEVRIKGAVICAGDFSGNGGEACVDFAPVTRDGKDTLSEHIGTHPVSLTPGFISVAGPDKIWTIGENWEYISISVNHWPPEATNDLDCANGGCEHDDRRILGFR